MLQPVFTPKRFQCLDEFFIKFAPFASGENFSSQFYLLENQVAQGADGDVYFGNSKTEPVAVKLVKLRNQNVKRHVLREMQVGFELLKKQTAPSSIVRLIDWFFVTPREVALVMEKCDFTLSHLVSACSASRDLLEKRVNPSWSLLQARRVPADVLRIAEVELQRILIALLQALAFLHSENLIHCDVKCDNIVWSFQSKQWKLCDFGSVSQARTMKVKPSAQLQQSKVGTLWTCAPEVIRRNTAEDGRVDIWSLGCVMWECGFLKKPFTMRELICFQNGLVNVLVPSLKGLPKWIYDKSLLSIVKDQMLKFNIEERSSAKDLLEGELVSKLSDVIDWNYRKLMRSCSKEVKHRQVTSLLYFNVRNKDEVKSLVDNVQLEMNEVN